MAFVSHDQSSEVLEPGEETFHQSLVYYRSEKAGRGTPEKGVAGTSGWRESALKQGQANALGTFPSAASGASTAFSTAPPKIFF